MDKREIKEKITKGWLRAHLVIEVLGKPANYIEESLNMAIDNLEQGKKAEVLEKKVHPAKLVPNAKEVFTTFAEVEILTQDMGKLIEIIFDYMPSSVEIVEPSNFAMKLEDANAVLNDLIGRLHQYDAIVKQLRIKFEILANKFKEIEAQSKGEKGDKEGEKEKKEDKKEKKK